MSFDYFVQLKKSWSDIFRNPVVFLPLLFSFIIIAVFVALLALDVLMLYFIFGDVMFSDPIVLLRAPLGIALIIVFFLADILILAAMGSFVRSMQMGGYKEVSTQGKTSFSSMLSYGKQYIWKYFFIQLIRMIIMGVPFLVLALINVPVYFISLIPAIVISVIFGIIYIIYAMIVGFLLFFLDPMVVSEKKGGLQLMRFSMDYSRSNIGHVILVFLMMMLVSSVVMGFLMVIGLMVGLFSGIAGLYSSTVQMLMVPVSWGFDGIRIAIQILMSVFLDMFFVNCYFRRNSK